MRVNYKDSAIVIVAESSAEERYLCAIEATVLGELSGSKQFRAEIMGPPDELRILVLEDL